MASTKGLLAMAWILLLWQPGAAEEATESSSVDTRPPVAPDIRDDDTELKLQRGNLVVVPIPISNPTLGTGLVAGAAWFYGQTAEQAAAQPASVTAAAGLYTNNNSRALVLGQQNYWSRNRWRFTGAAGVADLNLTLPTGDGADSESDWLIEGAFVFAKLARKFAGNWYGGMQVRAIDADQVFGDAQESDGFDVDASVNAVGVGVLAEYDSRDMPINSYAGRYFMLDALLNYDAIGSDSTYQNYSATYRAYHEVRDGLVFAWEFRAVTARAACRFGTPARYVCAAFRRPTTSARYPARDRRSCAGISRRAGVPWDSPARDSPHAHSTNASRTIRSRARRRPALHGAARKARQPESRLCVVEKQRCGARLGRRGLLSYGDSYPNY